MIKKGRKPLSFMLGYNLIYLGVNYLWISYETMILPTQVSLFISLASASFILGLTASIGNTFGILGNLGSGFLVDHIRKKLGMRCIVTLVGISGVVISLLFEATTKLSLLFLIAGYVSIQAFSNISMGSIQPVIAEIGNETDRGTSAGINGLFTLTGSALGFGITSTLLSSGLYDSSIYSIMIGITITGIGSAFVIAMHDRRSQRTAPPKANREKPLREIENTNFSLLAIGSFFVFSGITGLTYFELFFFRTVLHSSNPDLLVGIAGITVLSISAISSIVVGHFSHRLGRVRILEIAAIVAAIPTFMIPFFHNFYIFLILGSFIGASYGVYYSVSFAMAGELTPHGHSGRYIAFFYLSISMASALSPTLYGSMIFLFSQTYDNGFLALFSSSGFLYLVGAFILNYMDRRSRNPNSNSKSTMKE
ncbi:MAG: MFS transporter [Cuniculiplasma sp.]